MCVSAGGTGGIRGGLHGMLHDVAPLAAPEVQRRCTVIDSSHRWRRKDNTHLVARVPTQSPINSSASVSPGCLSSQRSTDHVVISRGFLRVGGRSCEGVGVRGLIGFLRNQAKQVTAWREREREPSAPSSKRTVANLSYSQERAGRHGIRSELVESDQRRLPRPFGFCRQ